ncbi:MAG TPA: hypothetical protein VHD33_01315 [Legionellaceae bacterium]|nr:hypothetical protein [Legionellaceae bacterium]
MAAQYSNRHFFRKTPNFYLSKFFAEKDIQLVATIEQIKHVLHLIPCDTPLKGVIRL